MPPASVLGVDLGPGNWANNGSALIRFDETGPLWRTIACRVIDWPTSRLLSPGTVANVIDEFARAVDIAAVSIDGPQGWRDPHAHPGRPGVGRTCEYSARTPCKTGVEGKTYPGNQLPWVTFSIAVFEELLRLEHTRLANDPGEPPMQVPPPGEYVVLECFPTSTWRSSRLVPLPAKRRKPDLAAFARALTTAYQLPPLAETPGHDDLQALVAALPAAALFGAARVIAHGEPARVVQGRDGYARVEGLIWDATP